ncbi:uncharacterized protein LOC106662308 isoform X2 [Cimex lectularius]|uniref:Uncharacterized protein n=1 Tax=Cimex lectularius TaxID=79782 RepID=A0A8I6RAY7_CIMLE|nr:uncharacterized protein LOC106662308 isoform X2 [Cimex lectularius]XP_014241810.1 uncharacterized protein LOC106662308 isoform X2 [Cimex lectularius]XP_014241812.1 uncharacterized protein LOC106662308 isoform X2 [Cimex lectularius]
MSERKKRQSILKKCQPTVEKLIEDLRNKKELDSFHVDPSDESVIMKTINASTLKFKELDHNSKSTPLTDSSDCILENPTDTATSCTKNDNTLIQNNQQLRQNLERKVKRNSARGSSGINNARDQLIEENLLKKANGITKSEYQITIKALVEEVERLSGKKISDYLQLTKLQKLITNSNDDMADDVFNYLMPNFDMPHRNYE